MTAARLVAVVVFALTLTGCAAPWAQTAAGVTDVAAQTWLAARGVPCLDAPPAPKVATERPPTVGEVLAILAWAAELQRQAAAVQRAGSEELAAQAAKAAALPPSHVPSPVYREAPEPLPTVAPKD